MITSQRYRAGLEITIEDIFQDFNDSRKETLMKRVAIAMEDLEKRMKSQIEANNLAHLQLMLKKQQILKGMEDKIKQAEQYRDQCQNKLLFNNGRIAQMQAEFLKKNNYYKETDDKMQHFKKEISKLTQTIVQNQALYETLLKEKTSLAIQNQRLQMENQNLAMIIKRTRQSFSQKVEENEFILKIKEQKLVESFNSSLENISLKTYKEKERESKIQHKKAEKKHQRIQVNLNDPAMHRLPSKLQQQRIFEEKAIQTDTTQQKKIIEFIESNPPQVKQQTLDQIRFMYSKSLQIQERETISITETTTKTEPKITKIFNIVSIDSACQTDSVQFKPTTPVKMEISCSAEIVTQQSKGELKSIQLQLQNLKIQYDRMQDLHERRYWEIVKIYEERPSLEIDIKEIQLLKLEIQQIKLQHEKEEQKIAQQRDLLSRMNQNLIKSQNSMLIKKMLGNKGAENLFSNIKVQKFNKTASIVYGREKRQKIHTQLSQIHHKDSSSNEHIQNFSGWQDNIEQNTIKPKYDKEELITVIKGNSTLKYFQHHKHSVKTDLTADVKGSLRVKRDFKKYSGTKRNSFFN